MAASNPKPQQRQTNFEIFEPLFYHEFNTQHPIFPEWTIERMPKNVDTRRINLDKFDMSNGWQYKWYNTKEKFRCIKCIKNGIKEDDATWTSAYVTVEFRAYYGPDTDEFGQTWIGGWIQMKIFAQRCKKCDEPITPELDNERSTFLVKWLHRWIANRYYGFNFPHHGYQGKKILPNHRSDLCNACHTGVCLYLKRKKDSTTKRNKTAINKN